MMQPVCCAGFRAAFASSNCSINRLAFLPPLQELGVDPARCVVIEDSRIGLAAAKAAGMRCACLLLPCCRTKCCAGLRWRACLAWPVRFATLSSLAAAAAAAAILSWRTLCCSVLCLSRCSCRCVVTESYYTKGEDFTIADAVFDCIGEAGDERFSLNDLTTPGLLVRRPAAQLNRLGGLGCWCVRPGSGGVIRLSPESPGLSHCCPPRLCLHCLYASCSALGWGRAGSMRCCCCGAQRAVRYPTACPCLPALPPLCPSAGSFWLNPPLPMDEQGRWINPPARPAEFVDVDPL